MNLLLLLQGDIVKLTADFRKGVHNQETRLSFVDKDTALQWLLKLDGRVHTLLSLERQDGWQLMVGGGPSQYVITLSDGSSNLTFCNSAGDGTKVVELCAGGQFGEFPQNICATYKQATEVVICFFDENERQESWI